MPLMQIESQLFWEFYHEYVQGVYGAASLGQAFVRRFPLSGGMDYELRDCVQDDRARLLIFSRYEISSRFGKYTSEVVIFTKKLM